jgi:hypothetical protein
MSKDMLPHRTYMKKNYLPKQKPGIISKDKKLQKAYETIIKKYDKTLKKLADR